MITMSDDTQGLLGLVMIVKDEVHGVARTLGSVRGQIDHWTILDTGSTDGTQQVVRDALSGIPGTLAEEAFVDFATSRNRALDLHGETTAFTLMIDSDDYLASETGALRRFCEDRRGEPGVDHEAYLVEMRCGSLGYYLPLLLRSRARWRYRGRVHEYACRSGAPEATLRVPGAQVRKEYAERSARATRRRWERDVDLLHADLAEDPRNDRAAYYLGQTYACLGEHAKALAAYEARIQIGGPADETFYAMLRRARCLRELGRPWGEVQEAYLEAHHFDPRRAEPLYEVARHYYDEQRHATSYLFASAAALLARPRTPMFVDQEVYDWRAADTASISAFYVAGRTGSDLVRAAGRRLAARAARANPDDGRLQHNLSFYARSAAEVFAGFSSRRLELELDAPYVPMNPSVHFDGAQWRCLVRAVNYRIGDGRYYGYGGDEIRTRNYLLELTSGLDVERVVEARDCDPTPRSDFPVHGFEDCRLVYLRGKPLATATVCDMNPYGDREIAILEIDPDDYRVRRATPVRGPWGAHHQKNWMPLVDGDRLRVVYSLLPEVTLDLTPVATGDAGDVVVESHGTTSFEPGRLRGGSQGVRIPDGWLFVVHAVTVDEAGEGRTYLHRFVKMSTEMRVVAASEPFYFLRRGIEFCAGLAVDGDRLVVSFGVEDREAYLGELCLRRVLDGLCPDLDCL